jgi:hypothetical protein
MTQREKEIIQELKKDIPYPIEIGKYIEYYRIGEITTSKIKLDEMVHKGMLKIGEHPLLGKSNTYFVNEW